MRQFDGAIERIDLATVRLGTLQDADDDAALILTGDGACRPVVNGAYMTPWRIIGAR